MKRALGKASAFTTTRWKLSPKTSQSKNEESRSQVAKNIITEKIKNMGSKCTTSFFLKYADWFGLQRVTGESKGQESKMLDLVSRCPKRGGKKPHTN